MKKIVLCLLILLTISSHAQDSADTYLSKVKTLDSTIQTLYSVISGEKGEERNWELFRFLFTDDAKLIPINNTKEGVPTAVYLSPDDYVNNAGKWLIENGFFEEEISRKVESFGAITHVFSTYQSFKSKKDKAPFMRGINSIQLLNDGNRWWIVNIFWMQETNKYPIPKQYLKN